MANSKPSLLKNYWPKSFQIFSVYCKQLTILSCQKSDFISVKFGVSKTFEYAPFLVLHLFFLLYLRKLVLSTYRCQKNWARTQGLVSNDRKFFRYYTFAKKFEKKLEIFWGYHWFLTIIAIIRTVNHLKITQIFINTIRQWNF